MIVVMLRKFKKAHEYYEFWQDDKCICKQVEPVYANLIYDHKFIYLDGTVRNLDYNINRLGSLREKATTYLYENGKCIGKMTGNGTNKKWYLLQSYTWDEIEWLGETYKLYDIFLRGQGHFLCVLKDDITVAIAEKDLVNVNGNDRYEVYIENPGLFPMLSLVLPRHNTANSQSNLYPGCEAPNTLIMNDKIADSFSKELKSKYDPNFISRIKAMDGII